MDAMDTMPSHSQQGDVGGSSAAKRKKRPPTSTRRQGTKRFKPPLAENMLRSPIVTPVTDAPVMRLVVSPVVMGPRSPALGTRNSPTSLAASPSASLGVERSPSPSPPPFLDEETILPDSTSGQCKLRRLKSEIWKDMDPIYQDGRVVQAQCKHDAACVSAVM
ncbi:unnamed protein product [Urochloa humidicola]